jgi:hypothetical protein
MTESGAEKRRGFWEERHALSAFIVRALMTFLGTVGALGCIMSSLGFSFGTGIFDIAVSLASVLFTYAMLRTGYHPYCVGAGAAVCLLFGLVRGSLTASGIAEISSRYVLAGSEGAEALAELSDGAGAQYAFAFFGTVMVLVLVWLLGQKIRRIIPAILITGVFPAVSVAIGIIPGYMYLIMLCLFWSMLLFDADELIGPSVIIVPLFCAVFLVILAAVPHSPHKRIEWARPAGQTAAPTTVGGENHDPPAETESTGETLQNDDDPRDAHPDADGETKLDRWEENGLEIPRQIARVVIVLLVIMILIALVPTSRLIRLRLRKRKTHSRNRNDSAIAEYRYMEQLAAFAGNKEDSSGEIWKRATEIGLKARFSGEMISAGELGEMHRLALFYREICMKRTDRMKHLIGKYYLAL